MNFMIPDALFSSVILRKIKPCVYANCGFHLLYIRPMIDLLPSQKSYRKLAVKVFKIISYTVVQDSVLKEVLNKKERIYR